MMAIDVNKYLLKSSENLKTPNLLLYPELVEENIKTIVKDISIDRLRPHVKTNKCKNLVQLMMDQGIHKFKCATLQEAKMLAELGVQDILIAYPIVGKQLSFLIDLQQSFPLSNIRIIIDNQETIDQLDSLSKEHAIFQDVFLDVNLGMNRTGILPENLSGIFDYTLGLSHVRVVGLHGYDGHIREEELQARETEVKAYFEPLLVLIQQLEEKFNKPLQLVFGGSNTFPIYQQYPNVECSPGTFILWDWGYHSTLPEQSYHLAAILISRVVSKPNTNLLCLDLGYKAISSENSIDKRMHFLDKINWTIISQSEEHLVVEVPANDWSSTGIGSFVYIAPYHICPTVAMYPRYQVVKDGAIKDQWSVLARY